jgi:hypothetical protein
MQLIIRRASAIVDMIDTLLQTCETELEHKTVIEEIETYLEEAKMKVSINSRVDALVYLFKKKGGEIKLGTLIEDMKALDPRMCKYPKHRNRTQLGQIVHQNPMIFERVSYGVFKLRQPSTNGK